MLGQLFSRTRAKAVAVLFVIVTIWQIVRPILDLYGYIQSANDALGHLQFLTGPSFPPFVYAGGLILLASAYVSERKKERHVGFAPDVHRKLNWWEAATIISFVIAGGLGVLELYARYNSKTPVTHTATRPQQPPSIPTPQVPIRKPDAHPPKLMSMAELIDLAEKGHRVGMQMKDIANEVSTLEPAMGGASPQQMKQMNRENRARWHAYFLPLLKRAEKLSAEIVAQDPPQNPDADRKNKEYAKFFHNAINGYDYSEIDGENAAIYLVTISDNLAGKIRREQEQK